MSHNHHHDVLIIKYIPLQQGLRLGQQYQKADMLYHIIKYIPLQQGLRQAAAKVLSEKLYH